MPQDQIPARFQRIRNLTSRVTSDVARLVESELQELRQNFKSHRNRLLCTGVALFFALSSLFIAVLLFLFGLGHVLSESTGITLGEAFIRMGGAAIGICVLASMLVVVLLRASGVGSLIPFSGLIERLSAQGQKSTESESASEPVALPEDSHA